MRGYHRPLVPSAESEPAVSGYVMLRFSPHFRLLAVAMLCRQSADGACCTDSEAVEYVLDSPLFENLTSLEDHWNDPLQHSSAC